ncbi:MAG: hypothetical protein ACLSX0_01620 [Anaerostipes caccae]|jgi:hypothetical protein
MRSETVDLPGQHKIDGKQMPSRKYINDKVKVLYDFGILISPDLMNRLSVLSTENDVDRLAKHLIYQKLEAVK